MPYARFTRSLAFVSTLVLSAFIAACSSSSSTSSSGSSGTTSSSGTSGTTVTGTKFRGTLTGKGESGVIDATLPAGIKTASLDPLTDPAPANQVVATINLGNGKTISLTGTYDPATKKITISGNGYTLTGTLDGSTLSGTYTGPNGGGAFALQAEVSGAVNVYCGTYESQPAGKDSGTWNLVQGADNRMSGSYTSSKGESGLLTGTLSGTAVSLTASSTAVATGTVSGDSMSGTYGPSAAVVSGTWTGTKGNCAK